MTPEHAPSSDGTPRLNPAAMTVEDAAKLLTKAGGVRIAAVIIVLGISERHRASQIMLASSHAKVG